MIFGLVKTGDRMYPNRQDPSWKVLGLGLLFVNGMAALFLPVGLFGTLFEIIFLLIILFLPSLYITIKLTKRFGNILLLAMFLGFVSGPLSALYLSKSLSYAFGIRYYEAKNPDSLREDSSARIVHFQSAKFLTNYLYTRTATIRFRATDSREIFFHIIPWVKEDWEEGDAIYTWAVCTSYSQDECDWKLGDPRTGEMYPRSELYKYYLEVIEGAVESLHLNAKFPPRLMVPISDPRDRFLRTGLYGGLGLLVINYLWIIGVIILKRGRKE
ncbi:hypothetical protein CH373_08235 [Leptospira perolatii]|uniref:Uncharacterized protein n=1 Tax=Leptospira perolatii TaxID=2023191 RepID=A0A2M9ZNC8_9LEPT|nr:hypothetical protein [Leptospira perolatii]PJZ68890.1 hypothetical protein CH360_13480 [Leptospira perolatii]PJZ73491.1 hypothetical protein CH373_08235 [Leptospira perolatii]